MCVCVRACVGVGVHITVVVILYMSITVESKMEGHTRCRSEMLQLHSSCRGISEEPGVVDTEEGETP